MLTDLYFNFRSQIIVTETPTDVTSVLIITSVSRSDNGTYMCIAENEYGSDTAAIVMLVVGKKFFLLVFHRGSRQLVGRQLVVCENS